MTTLVTGAAGFIGSAVVRRLLGRGRAVRALVEPGAPTANLDGLDVEQVPGNILDQAGLERAMAGCDAVYHLAAIYRLWTPDERLVYDVNVEGTKNVLYAAKHAGVAKHRPHQLDRGDRRADRRASSPTRPSTSTTGTRPTPTSGRSTSPTSTPAAWPARASRW